MLLVSDFIQILRWQTDEIGTSIVPSGDVDGVMLNDIRYLSMMPECIRVRDGKAVRWKDGRDRNRKSHTTHQVCVWNLGIDMDGQTDYSVMSVWGDDRIYVLEMVSKVHQRRVATGMRWFERSGVKKVVNQLGSLIPTASWSPEGRMIQMPSEIGDLCNQ